MDRGRIEGRGKEPESEYPKPWESYEEQLDFLVNRGLAVTDRSKAMEYLQRIGYYRLSGYWFPFRERSAYCIRPDWVVGQTLTY